MRRLLAIVCLSLPPLLAGCSDTPPLAPELTSVTPSPIRSLEAVTLRLEGQRFFRRRSVDFNDAQAGEAIGSPAVLLRSGTTELPLALAAHPGPTVLEVIVPAGTAPGAWDVVLTDAWGRTVALPGGLRVLEDCESETGPFVGEACDGADADPCEDDAWFCAGTVLTCSLGEDNVEVCDGIDNDCDPSTPDGAAEPGFDDVCDGPDSDTCADDRMVCDGTALACATGDDTLEVCDGEDNDCNDQTPDGSDEPLFEAACDGADADRCNDPGEIYLCTGAGGLVCAASADNLEVCDGEDNDCDGDTEDGSADPQLNQPCDGDDPDTCMDGVWECTGGGLSCTDGPTSTCGISVKVGEFNQGATTVTHNLGFVPKLLLIWTTGSSGFAPAQKYELSFGMVDEARSARASASTHGGNFDMRRAMAESAIYVVNGSGTVLANAQVTAWNASTFTLDWQTDSLLHRYQYLAIGGDQVQSKLLRWQMATATGLTSSTNPPHAGAGFTPSGAFIVHNGYGLTGTPPTGDGTGMFALGAVAGGAQFTSMFNTAPGAAPTNTWRSQVTSSCLRSFDSTGVVQAEASCGLSSDGHSANFTDAAPSAGQVSSLLVGGLQMKAFCFNKPNGSTPTTQSITGIGFQPEGILFASDNSDSPEDVISDALFSIGASTVTANVASALHDEDAEATTPKIYSRAVADAAYLEIDQLTGAVVEAFAVSSFDSDGFTLSWNPNFAANGQICGVAFGSAP